jgi:hypothetical protein
MLQRVYMLLTTMLAFAYYSPVALMRRLNRP